jgi:hypothetical protein
MKGGFFDYWIVKLAPEDPLPVTLKSFLVTKENTTTLLTWETATETNSNNFEIEHSLNAKSLNHIGTVNAKATCFNPINSTIPIRLMVKTTIG